MYNFAKVGNDRYKKVHFCILTYMEVCYENIKLALTIAIIGAINWGLIGFFDFNLVSGIFGDATAFTRVIYALVGLSGIYMISLYGRACADA